MSFTTFTPAKFTRNFFAPTNPQKAGGAAHHPARNEQRSIRRNPNPTTENLKHAPETVGHIMTGDYVTVESTLTAGAALEKVRVMAHVFERIYTIYVTGPEQRLDGVISLRSLLIADPTLPVSHFMSHPNVCITNDTAQERAARIMEQQSISEIPVIDRSASLVGIVTAESVKHA